MCRFYKLKDQDRDKHFEWGSTQQTHKEMIKTQVCDINRDEAMDNINNQR